MGGGSAFVCYTIIDLIPDYYLQAPNVGPLVAIAVVCICVWLLTGIMITVLDVAAEALLICYLADTEMAEHNGEPMHARSKLIGWVKSPGKKTDDKFQSPK